MNQSYPEPVSRASIIYSYAAMRLSFWRRVRARMQHLREGIAHEKACGTFRNSDYIIVDRVDHRCEIG